MAQVVQAIIEDKSESKFYFYLIQISRKMCCLPGSSSLIVLKYEAMGVWVRVCGNINVLKHFTLARWD